MVTIFDMVRQLPVIKLVVISCNSITAIVILFHISFLLLLLSPPFDMYIITYEDDSRSISNTCLNKCICHICIRCGACVRSYKLWLYIFHDGYQKLSMPSLLV